MELKTPLRTSVLGAVKVRRFLSVILPETTPSKLLDKIISSPLNSMTASLEFSLVVTVAILSPYLIMAVEFFTTVTISSTPASTVAPVPLTVILSISLSSLLMT